MRGTARQLPFDRAQRIAEQIHSVIAFACLTELADKRLAGVQITYVTATKDLRLVRVNFYVEPATPERIREVQRGFRSASGFLKQAIGREMQLKFIPDMEFFFDEGLHHQSHMDQVMQAISPQAAAKKKEK